MPFKNHLMGLGTPGILADAQLGGFDATVTALGTNQATAYQIVKSHTTVTTAGSGTGLLLPVTALVESADNGWIVNQGANTIAVYPQVGGSINGLSANTSVTIASNKAAHWQSIDGALNYSIIVGA